MLRRALAITTSVGWLAGSVLTGAERPAQAEQPLPPPATEQTSAQSPKQGVGGRALGLFAFEGFSTDASQSSEMSLIGATGDALKYVQWVNARIRYKRGLGKALTEALEDVLKGSDVVTYVPTTALEYWLPDSPATEYDPQLMKAGALPAVTIPRMLMPLAAFIRANHLYAGVSAKMALGTNGRLKKELSAKTLWTLTTFRGYQVRIQTASQSIETYGMSPDPNSDPQLGPAVLALAREEAKQFLEKLAEIMKRDQNLAEDDRF
jgi:hypothetical protein